MNVLYLVRGDDPDLHVIKLHRTTYTHAVVIQMSAGKSENQSKSMHVSGLTLTVTLH